MRLAVEVGDRTRATQSRTTRFQVPHPRTPLARDTRATRRRAWCLRPRRRAGPCRSCCGSLGNPKRAASRRPRSAGRPRCRARRRCHRRPLARCLRHGRVRDGRDLGPRGGVVPGLPAIGGRRGRRRCAPGRPVHPRVVAGRDAATRPHVVRGPVRGRQLAVQLPLPALRHQPRRGRDPDDVPAYADRALELAADWIADNPRDGAVADMAWNDHSTALRAVVFACIADRLAAPDWLLASLVVHGETLADPAFYVNRGNHALNQAIGLLEVGRVLARKDWIDLAVQRITTLSTRASTPRGSPTSRRSRTSSTTTAVTRLRRAGCSHSASRRPQPSTVSQLMPELLAYATLPSGYYELLGDTSDLQAASIPGTWAEFTATAGASGPRPPSRIRRFAAGFLFARSGWGTSRTFQDETALSIRYGPKQAIHGHDDGASLTLAAWGSRLLVDPGMYAYQGGAFRDLHAGTKRAQRGHRQRDHVAQHADHRHRVSDHGALPRCAPPCNRLRRCGPRPADHLVTTPRLCRRGRPAPLVNDPYLPPALAPATRYATDRRNARRPDGAATGQHPDPAAHRGLQPARRDRAEVSDPGLDQLPVLDARARPGARGGATRPQRALRDAPRSSRRATKPGGARVHAHGRRLPAPDPDRRSHRADRGQWLLGDGHGRLSGLADGPTGTLRRRPRPVMSLPQPRS